jgi:hypothetical protein
MFVYNVTPDSSNSEPRCHLAAAIETKFNKGLSTFETHSNVCSCIAHPHKDQLRSVNADVGCMPNNRMGVEGYRAILSRCHKPLRVTYDAMFFLLNYI